MIRLKNWSVISTQKVNEYTSPELIFLKLQGKVYGHPNDNIKDGQDITTSKIIELDIEKNIAKTYSGHTYVLDSPDEKWTQWLRDKFKNKYLGKMFLN